MDLEFRELRKEDYDQIKKIINETWNFDSFSDHSGQVRNALEIYLRNCLLQQNYSRVALDKGVPVGLILGRINRDFKPLKQIPHLFALIWAGLKFSLRIFAGKKFIQQAREERRVYDKLLRERKRVFDGEVVLFIVSPNERGRGLGKKLIFEFLDYCREKNLNCIYLFSDTSCNYGFYDSNGFLRTGELTARDFSKEGSNSMRVFLYEYHFQKKQENL